MTPPPLMHVVDVCEDNLGVLAWIWTDPLTHFRSLLSTRLLAPFDPMMVFLPTSLFVSGRPASSMNDCLAMHNKPRTFHSSFAAWLVAILASREIIDVTISVVRSSSLFFYVFPLLHAVPIRMMTLRFRGIFDSLLFFRWPFFFNAKSF
jgi:hypothetical protein